jgi:hypothetical protein
MPSLTKQAFEKEKQHILDFTRNAVRKILDEDIQNPFNLEQYYNENFKNKKLSNMVKITKKSTVRKFKVGDKVQFHTSTNERGMSIYSGTEYGVIGNINRGVITVGTETDIWEANEDELKLYKDPFAWFHEGED